MVRTIVGLAVLAGLASGFAADSGLLGAGRSKVRSTLDGGRALNQAFAHDHASLRVLTQDAPTSPPILPAAAVDDRRSQQPWRPAAGRFSRAADVAVAPDGTTYVLDTGQDALHVLDANGTPRARWPRAWGVGDDPTEGGDPPSNDPWRAQRLDTGPRGRPHLLLSGPVAAGKRAGKVLVLEQGPEDAPDEGSAGHLGALGVISATFDLSIPAAERYADIAVAPDGRILVVHTSGDIHNRGSYGIDLLDPSAPVSDSIRFVPEEPWIPVSVDFDAEGRAWIVSRSTHDHVPGSTANHGLDAIYGFAPEAFSAEPGTDRRPAPVQTLPFVGAMDISAGPAGLLVSRDAQIVAVSLDGAAPSVLHTGPLVERTHFTEPPLGATNLYALDQQPDGRIFAATDHCAFQGLTMLEVPEASFGRAAEIDKGVTPAVDALSIATAADLVVRYVGALDRPRLAGPLLPWRIAAADEVVLLQERVTDPPRDAQGQPREAVGSAPIVFAPHSVQRWSAEGTLVGQVGVCGSWTDPLAVRDVARDGERIYTLTEDRLRWHGDPHRDAGPFAGGETWLAAGSTDPAAAAHGFALDAWGAEPVVLDLGQNRVHFPGDPVGRFEDASTWASLVAGDPARPEVLARDVATRDSAIFLLDGDGRVRALRAPSDGLLAAQGARGRSWAAPGAPISLALDGWFVYGPGRVALLHEGGWITVHEAWTGDLLATVAPTDPLKGMRDLSVDDAGRIHVAWLDAQRQAEREGRPVRTTGGQTIVRRAGIQTLDLPELRQRVWPPMDAAPLAPPARGACLVAPEFTAPATARSREPITLTLRLDAMCPPAEAPLDLALVVEVSQATSANGGIDRARGAAMRLLTRLGGDVRVTLTTFDDAVVTRSASAESESLAHVAQRLAGLEATAGGSRGITEALRAGAEGLAALPTRADARRALLLITDGRAPLPDVAGLLAAGIAEMRVLVVPGLPLPWTGVQALEAAIGDPLAVHLDATPEGLAELARALRAGEHPTAELAEVSIEMGLPRGWALAPADGAADGVTRPRVDGDRLRWSMLDVVGGSELRWRIIATQPGLRAVARSPVVRWRDGHGHEGGWSLRAPHVAVDGGRTIWLPGLALGTPRP
jgi:hypothetical protein